ncbi:MAG: KH domain-containing protein [Acidobacteria bacterium]|nr:KH domain-containing protein [Acidobacteriota bacterium]
MSAELDTQVIDFVQSILHAMGLDLTVTVEDASDNVRLDITGDGADVLIKRRGEVLDALQVVVNTAFRRHARGERHYVIDALGFRQGKDEELRQMALFLAQKARTTGVPQEIGPLNPYARRIVHLAVSGDPAVSSESIGDAFLKTVVISAKR